MSNATQGSTTTRLTLGGMGCGSCADTITKVLSALPGVSTATVDFDAKLATVSHDAGQTADTLIKAVEDAGYEAHLA